MPQELTWKAVVDPAIAVAGMRELASVAKTTTADIEASVRKEAQAAIALQRQRSAALVSQWKSDAKEAESAEKAKMVAALRNSAQTAASTIQLAQSTANASSITEKAIEALGEKLNVFVGERLPIVGGGFIRISENLRNLHVSLKPVEGSVLNLGKAIAEMSSKSGKSVSEIKPFLEIYQKLGTQAEKDSAAFNFFGAAVDKISPSLRSASTEMAALAEAGGEAGAGVSGLAGPIGIAVLAAAALVAGTILLNKELFDLTEKAAEFQGKMFDLSQQTGVSVETLSAFEILAKTTGGDIESITASLGIFQKHLEAAHDPTSKEAGLLKGLGIETNNTEQSIRQAFATLSKMPEGFRQTATALELFGRGGKAVLAMLKEMHGDLDGAISRFRQMGILITTEDAKAADEFNDQLALLNFQIRAVTATLGKEAMPTFLDAAREFSAIIKENKEGIELFGKVIHAIATVNLTLLNAALREARGIGRTFETGLTALKVAAMGYAFGLDQAYEALRRLHEEQGVGGPARAEGEIKATPETFGKTAAQEAEASLNTIKNAATEAKQIATNAIQAVDQAFERGQSSRREQIIQTMFLLKENEKFQQDAIAARIDDLEKQKKAAVNTADIEKQIDEARSQARITRRQLESDLAKEQGKLDADVHRQRIDNLHAETDALLQSNARQLQIVKNNTAAFGLTELQAFAKTTTLTEEGFAIKEAALRRELALAGRNEQEQEKINRQLQSLDAERVKARIDQAEQLRQIQEKENTESVEREKTRIDTILRLTQISETAQINSLKSLAAARLRTEEETETAILAVRLRANDIAIDAAKAGLTAAGTIADPTARAREQARLNDELRILQAERLAIQQQGEADIQAGRDKDIENLAAYEDAYARLLLHGIATDEETAKLHLELLRARNAPFIEILRAELAEQVAAENKRNAIERARIDDERDAALKRVKGLADEDEKKKEIQLQYDLDVEREAKRHKTAMGVIDAQFGSDPKKQGLELFKKSNPFIEAQKEINALFGEGTQKAQLYNAALGAMDLAAQGVAQAVGQMAQAWILYGSTGQSFQQMAAQIIASLASQALAQAAYYAACALAWEALFWFTGNPAYQAAAVKAGMAAIAFGLVGGVAAVAGRAVAGASFANAATGNTGSRTTSGTGTQTNQQPQPINLSSQRQQAVHVTVDLVPNRMFDAKVVNIVVTDMRTGGEMRTATRKEIGRQE